MRGADLNTVLIAVKDLLLPDNHGRTTVQPWFGMNLARDPQRPLQ